VPDTDGPVPTIVAAGAVVPATEDPTPAVLVSAASVVVTGAGGMPGVVGVVRIEVVAVI
jgi:hypothetical protein